MEKFLRQYEILLKKSAVDLKAAKNLFRDFNNGDLELDLEIIYFHLQQSSEKLIKTLLVVNKLDFPKVHDLTLLIKILNDNSIKSIDAITTTPNQIA